MTSYVFFYVLVKSLLENFVCPFGELCPSLETLRLFCYCVMHLEHLFVSIL